MSESAVRHLKKVDSTETLFDTVAGEFHTNHKSKVIVKPPEFNHNA